MKLDQLPSISSESQYLIAFESDAERALTNDQLITLLDNCVGLVWDEHRRSYRLNSKRIGEPQHFGGKVERYGSTDAFVLIYHTPQVPAALQCGCHVSAQPVAAGP